MPLFDKVVPQSQIPENSQEIARATYTNLVDGESETSIFVKGLVDGYKIWMGTWVRNAAKNLETDAIASIVANPTQTNEDWAASVSVAKLHKVTVLQDIIKYNPDYDEDRTFEEFVTVMTSGE